MSKYDSRTTRATTLGPGLYWGTMAFALLFPTLLTWAYFVLLARFPSGWQQAVYGAGKLLQFGFPLLWVLLLQASPSWPWSGWRRSGWRGVGWGLAFGSLVFLLMWLLCRLWLQPAGYLAGVEQQAIQKVRDLGLDHVGTYAATAVFYALAHSLLEEYYWRWFVFGQLQTRIGRGGAIALSSVGFMAHHVILLGTFFGWRSPLGYLCSVGVAIGGAVWAWIYCESRSLLGPWLSHMLIDAAIFLIGYQLVSSALH